MNQHVVSPVASRGPWLQVIGEDFSGRGKRFDLAFPTPAMIDFDVMATVLSRIPRYTGHTQIGTITVAQHIVEGARAILRDTGRRDWAAAFLLHDGHEYVVGDIATPVQEAIAFFAVLESGDVGAEHLVHRAIRALKRKLDASIYAAALIPWPLSAETARVVKAYDLRMLRTERDERMAQPPEPWFAPCENAEPIAGVDLNPWTERQARVRLRSWMIELLPVFGDQTEKTDAELMRLADDGCRHTD